MRIVQACPYAWDVPGGVQVHVRQLSNALRARGHEVVVLAPGRGEDEPGVRLMGRPLAIPYQGTVAPICPSPLSARRVRAALRSLRPDVVHVHEPLIPSTSMFAARSSDAPVVATFHAHAERSRLYDVAAPALRPIWRRLSARIAVSNAAARFVSSRFRDGVRVIPNGIDVSRFRDAAPTPGLPEGRRVLWVGRLDRQKGFPVAIAAFEELALADPELSLLVAGDGRDRGAVERLAPDILRRVRLLGALPHDELPPWYAAADVYVSPALGQESFGLVLVEAMAAGTPVVASRIAGYDEVVSHEVDGLLVAPGDAGALAAAVRRVLDEPELAARLVAAGHERAREFDWERVAGQIEDVYREITGTS